MNRLRHVFEILTGTGTAAIVFNLVWFAVCVAMAVSTWPHPTSALIFFVAGFCLATGASMLIYERQRDKARAAIQLDVEQMVGAAFQKAVDEYQAAHPGVIIDMEQPTRH